jgi:iron complex transport system permease protein
MSRARGALSGARAARRRGLPGARGVPLLAGLLALLAVLVPAALGIGAVHIAPSEIAAIVGAQFGLEIPGWTFAPQQAAVLLAIRLPRTLLGLLAGGTLGACGAAIQALFRNPLADPTLIGTASGAALGAALAIVLLPTLPFAAPAWLGAATLPLAAFAGSAATTALVYRLAARDGVTPVATLLLAGIALTALANAGVGLLTYLASDAQLRSLVFWNLGSLGGATWQALAGAAPWLLLTLALLPASATALNLLLLGEREARHLGIDVERLTRRTVFLVALGVGAAVAVCGVIGFVGLMVPHLVRLIAGPDHRIVLPGSMALGAALLIGADLVSRTIVAPAELPIGVVTAFAGAPFFLWLLRRTPAQRWG